jgi:hypothetical protein
VAQAGAFTFAEAAYLTRAAMVFRNEQEICCLGTVLYGDPAWEARVASEIPAPYTQKISVEKSGTVITYTVSVTFNNDFEGRPAAVVLEEPILNPQVKSVAPQVKVAALDNLIMIDCDKRKKGDEITVVVSGEITR